MLMLTLIIQRSVEMESNDFEIRIPLTMSAFEQDENVNESICNMKENSSAILRGPILASVRNR